jgi:hypothetical protein
MTRFKKGDYVVSLKEAVDIYHADLYSLKTFNLSSSIDEGIILVVTKSYQKSFWGRIVFEQKTKDNAGEYYDSKKIFIGMPYDAFKKISHAEAMALML